ncbi:hypothetical protein ACFQAV_02045 [Companilactobacillus huachuanensis]|uniref:Uncharacterized protein n=1 Tax=Companilactobacillus huachuanensis TaxID=2559914 RepID=A0ABW1RHQ0_9LACO|nr:hypothetical protein [Companilactobacillus huachuanensis]
MEIFEESQKKLPKLVNTIDFVTDNQKIRSNFDIFEFKRLEPDESDVKNDSKKYINFPYEKLHDIKKCTIADQYYSVFLIALKDETSLEYLQNLQINDYQVSVSDINDLREHPSSLVNLFLNLYGSKILPQTRISESTSCIYGDFFYPVGENKNPYNRYVLKFKYYKGLNMTVQSFKKRINERGVKYFWDDNSLVPTRIYNSIDDTSNCWVKGGKNSKKNSITFLSLKNFEEYKKSKVGSLYTILDDFNEDMRNYVKFFLNEMPENEEIVYRLSSNKQSFLKNAIKYFSNKEINIVDYINEDKSIQFVEILSVLLKQEFPSLGVQKSENLKSGINISIIKNRDYYLKENLDDPYQSSSKNVIVQNITEDNLEIKEKTDLIRNTIFLKILQELMVKDSIGKNRIDFDVIPKAKINSKYRFVTFHNKYVVTSRFDVDGKIDFDIEKSEDFFNEESVLVHNLADLGIENKNKGTVECVFYDDVKNPNVILNIGIYELPRMKRASKRLELADRKRKVNVCQIINDLKLFENKYVEYKCNDHLKTVKQLLNEIDMENISLGEYCQLLGKCNITGKKKIGKAYTEFLLEIDSSYIAFSNHKGKEFKADYSPLYWNHFFKSIPGIDNKIYARGIRVPVNHEFYSVAEGTESIKQTYEKGYPIREIRNKGFRFS